MEITPVGYIVIPLGLAVFLFRSWHSLLYLLIFFAPFTGTAIINVPSITLGIQPAYFLGGMLIARRLMEGGASRKQPTFSKRRVWGVLPFWAFCAVAFVSILAIPLYDAVVVHRPSGDDELLALSRTNATQFMYLLYVVALATCIGFCELTEAQVKRALKVVLASGVFISLWGWFQVGCYFVGVPYPDFLFNNSISFAQIYGNTVRGLGLQRISSVAPEPSMFARFMLVPTFISFYCVYKRGFLVAHKYAVGLALFFALTSLLSLSSTAYAGLACGFAFLVAKTVREQRGSLLGLAGLSRRVTILMKAFAAVAVLGGAFLVAARLAVGLQLQDVASLVDKMVLSKTQSHSGQVRLSGAWAGVDLAIEHPLLGVGWGSNRTFDLTTHVLANTGLVGAFLFFGGHLALLWRGARTGRHLERLGWVGRAAQVNVLVVALAAVLIGKMLAEPDIVYLDQWILVGLLVAATVRFGTHARSAQRRSHRASQKRVRQARGQNTNTLPLRR